MTVLGNIILVVRELGVERLSGLYKGVDEQRGWLTHF
jgi:hypothetical protein